MIKVTENIGKTIGLIRQAERTYERAAGTVRLLAVSKRQSPEKVSAAARAGQRDFGENFAQEGIEKIATVNDPHLIWHFIGHLQSNKSRDIAAHFSWVHTLDRWKIATRLSAQRPATLGDLNVCIQVNIDSDPGKAGAAAENATELALRVAELPRLRLRGLMCIPRPTDTHAEQRLPFARLRELAEHIRGRGLELDTLSMGMSSDYAAAIREGATMVRIGTAVFGQRTRPED